MHPSRLTPRQTAESFSRKFGHGQRVFLHSPGTWYQFEIECQTQPGIIGDCAFQVGVASILMPTVFRVGPYRFYFYSHGLISESPHVHVDRDELSAKFWMNPVALARNLGYNASELRKIEKTVREHQY